MMAAFTQGVLLNHLLHWRWEITDLIVDPIVLAFCFGMMKIVERPRADAA